MSTASIFILPTTGTFIVEVVIFLTLLFLLAKYILPPLNAAMEKRQEEIRNSMASADQAKADAAAADDERRAELERARQQAREIIEQANRTAEQVTADSQLRGQAEYERLVTAAQQEIDLARVRALEEAAGRLGDVVMEVVERVIGREVDATAHRDLIDEAVSALSSPGVGGAAAGAGSRS